MKRAQVQQIDWIFAFFIFILFITIAVMVINFIAQKPDIKIYKDVNLISQYLKETTDVITTIPYIIITNGNYNNALISFKTDSKNITVDQNYWEIVNNKVYVITPINKRKIIKVTELPFAPAQKYYSVDFTCLNGYCLKQKQGIQYFFNNDLFSSLFYNNAELIKNIKYTEDGYNIIITNTSTIQGQLFYERIASNPILQVSSLIYDLNPRLFVSFSKINENIPYTSVDINFSLPKYQEFTSYNFYKKQIDYQYAKVLNKTWCIADNTTIIELYLNSTKLILQFSIPAIVQLCTNGTNLNMNIQKAVESSFNFSVYPTDSELNVTAQKWMIVNVTKGMPKSKEVLDYDKLEKLYQKNNLESQEPFDVIVTDRKGKIMFSFNTQNQGESKTFPELMDMIIPGITNMTKVIVSFVFWSNT